MHPLAYPRQEGFTGHYVPVRGPGLLDASMQKSEAPLAKNVNFRVSATPFGSADPTTPSMLEHYDLRHKLPDVLALAQHHGFTVVPALDSFGRHSLHDQNYDTGHLPIHNSGDPGTDAWRISHELASALTRSDANKLYGEGKRVGKMLTHLTPREASRAVHWASLAADKQRELLSTVGANLSEDQFARERNVVLGDAVHRVLTGEVRDPAQEGFRPATHLVPVEAALQMVTDHAGGLGPHERDNLRGASMKKSDDDELATPEDVRRAAAEMLMEVLERNEEVVDNVLEKGINNYEGRFKTGISSQGQGKFHITHDSGHGPTQVASVTKLPDGGVAHTVPSQYGGPDIVRSKHGTSLAAIKAALRSRNAYMGTSYNGPPVPKANLEKNSEFFHPDGRRKAPAPSETPKKHNFAEDKDPARPSATFGGKCRHCGEGITHPNHDKEMKKNAAAGYGPSVPQGGPQAAMAKAEDSTCPDCGKKVQTYGGKFGIHKPSGEMPSGAMTGHLASEAGKKYRCSGSGKASTQKSELAKDELSPDSCGQCAQSMSPLSAVAGRMYSMCMGCGNVSSTVREENAQADAAHGGDPSLHMSEEVPTKASGTFTEKKTPGAVLPGDKKIKTIDAEGSGGDISKLKKAGVEGFKAVGMTGKTVKDIRNKAAKTYVPASAYMPGMEHVDPGLKATHVQANPEGKLKFTTTRPDQVMDRQKLSHGTSLPLPKSEEMQKADDGSKEKDAPGKCPNCKSANVNMRGSSLATRDINRTHLTNSTCNDCGTKWQFDHNKMANEFVRKSEEMQKADDGKLVNNHAYIGEGHPGNLSDVKGCSHCGKPKSHRAHLPPWNGTVHPERVSGPFADDKAASNLNKGLLGRVAATAALVGGMASPANAAPKASSVASIRSKAAAKKAPPKEEEKPTYLDMSGPAEKESEFPAVTPKGGLGKAQLHGAPATPQAPTPPMAPGASVVAKPKLPKTGGLPKAGGAVPGQPGSTTKKPQS